MGNARTAVALALAAPTRTRERELFFALNGIFSVEMAATSCASLPLCIAVRCAARRLSRKALCAERCARRGKAPTDARRQTVIERD